MKIKFRNYISTFLFIILLLNSLETITYCMDEEKVIYLTFDDGPAGKVTTDILDILKKEDVPATFFLIGDQIKGQNELLLRMKNEGHSIGLHSMSHNRNNLYSANERFLKEMLDAQNIIKEITGETSNILRFPFGCNNNSYHLKPELVELLHENNLKIYDWNVDTTDGANNTASPSTYIRKCKSDGNEIILLMHCGYLNKNSVKALPDIIKLYKDKGYNFKEINDTTKELYHYIKK
ncbi:MAG TPA: polysaccharide deacetylase family protein [Clostridium sp.]